MELKAWTQSLHEIASLLQTDPERGLPATEATKRLLRNGLNRLPRKGHTVWWRVLLGQFASLLIWLLIVAAVIAGLLGDAIDAWTILAIILLNAILGFFQEYRAERSLEALQKLASPLSKVIREGQLQIIPSEKLVEGDLILLEAGDRVPADARVVSVSHVSIDESSLTGESTPVAKFNQPLAPDLSLGDRKNMVFMGTVVVAGKASALITRTGLKTEMGKIASQLLKHEKKEKTPLQEQLDHLGTRLVYLCIAIVIFIFVLGVLRGNELIEMLLVSLSLAVAAIPEGLPAVVTVSLAVGVRRMAEKKALIRRLSSVETLGSTTIICTDKTGTLTQNAMTVRSIWVDGQLVGVSGTGYSPMGEFEKASPSLSLALQIGILCNSAHLYEEKGVWKVVGDPTEGSLIAAAAKASLNKSELEKEYPLLDELPFDSERKMMSMLRKTKQGVQLFVKGAPDRVLEHCTHWHVNGKTIPLSDKEREEISLANDALAQKAYRVLALAYKESAHEIVEEDLIFVGLIGMIDPPRPEVKEAIRTCKKAGIRTVMVTGDHKKTALAIARELEMDEGMAIDGKELDAMSDAELFRQIDSILIFSRINAEHKLRIVKFFKEKGHVTAMTGDGVNDAPAVLAADIGISMGIAGTDVTKQSSDMIILDDNFASIVQAVKQGRGIYDNIVKFVSYLLSSNIAEILILFIPMLLGTTGPNGAPFIALLPVQLLWMNLVTDGLPALSLAMDPLDPKAMERPPRQRHVQILNPHFSLFICSLSLLITIGAMIACFWGLRISVALSQTMIMTTLILLELVRVQMIRKQYRLTFFSNPYLIFAIASSVILQLIVLYVPGLQIVFGTVPLALREWAVILGIVFLVECASLLVTKIFYK